MRRIEPGLACPRSQGAQQVIKKNPREGQSKKSEKKKKVGGCSKRKKKNELFRVFPDRRPNGASGERNPSKGEACKWESEVPCPPL